MLLAAVTTLGCDVRQPADAPASRVLQSDSALESVQQRDSSRRFLFYFHGRIIEDQGLPAVSPLYGEYQYHAILDRFAAAGFTVVSDVRPPDADSDAYARLAVARIDSLISSGVSPSDITIVGASKGAHIASLASHYARQPHMNVVLLAGCQANTVSYMLENDVRLTGRVLAIRDSADTELSGSCAELFTDLDDADESEIRHDELVLELGIGHGIIFRPLDEWILPTINWANAKN